MSPDLLVKSMVGRCASERVERSPLVCLKLLRRALKVLQHALVFAGKILLFLVLTAATASAEVVRIDVRSRDDFGTHERVIARVHYAVDPRLPVNQAIADLAFAPKNPEGRVEFAGDLLLFLPKRTSSAR